MAILRSRKSLRDAMLTLVRDALNEGNVEILYGALPAEPEEALFGQLLLGTLQLANPSGANPDGNLVLEPVADGAAESDFSLEPDADPAQQFFARFYDADGDAVLDVDIGLLDSDATLRVDTLNFIQGEPIRAQTWILAL